MNAPREMERPIYTEVMHGTMNESDLRSLRTEEREHLQGKMIGRISDLLGDIGSLLRIAKIEI